MFVPFTPLLNQVVIDPPFVQEACWRAYSKTANLLLREGPLSAAAVLRKVEEEKMGEKGAVSSSRHSSGDAALPSAPVVTKPTNNSATDPAEVLATTALTVVEEGVGTFSIAEDIEAAAQVSKGRTGLVLLTTILENAPLLEELFGVKPNKFRPSIPNLVYQYHIFTNYYSTGLSQVNSEVGE